MHVRSMLLSQRKHEKVRFLYADRWLKFYCRGDLYLQYASYTLHSIQRERKRVRGHRGNQQINIKLMTFGLNLISENIQLKLFLIQRFIDKNIWKPKIVNLNLFHLRNIGGIVYAINYINVWMLIKSSM